MPSQTIAHGFAQTDTVKHCPFCGSGDVWGGSDGTITCEFDGATFQVSVEPQYPSAPGNIMGQPLDIDGQPDEFGQANAEDAMAIPEGVAPSSGEDLGFGEGDEEDMGPVQDEGEGGGPPWAQGQDEEEDEDEEEAPPFPPKRSSYRTYMGDLLSKENYLKHLAIRHAEEPIFFMASLRTAARRPQPQPMPPEYDPVMNENPRCPDFEPHWENAAERLGYNVRHLDGLQRGEVGDEALKEYRMCPGHY